MSFTAEKSHFPRITESKGFKNSVMLTLSYIVTHRNEVLYRKESITHGNYTLQGDDLPLSVSRTSSGSSPCQDIILVSWKGDYPRTTVCPGKGGIGSRPWSENAGSSPCHVYRDHNGLWLPRHLRSTVVLPTART